MTSLSFFHSGSASGVLTTWTLGPSRQSSLGWPPSSLASGGGSGLELVGGDTL